MIDLLRSRRSIRKFTSQPIEAEKIEIIKEALLRSPSSRGINPWRFILVDDRALLEKLASAKKSGGEFLRHAALAIAICADDRQSDVWVEDCSIAAIICQLTAHSLGLGSCWVQIRNRPHNEKQSAEESVREILGIPPSIKVECIVAVGYPDESPKPVPAAKLKHDRIGMNRFA